MIPTILRRSDELPRLDVYAASPPECTSHRELFEIATRCYYGRSAHPILMPRLLAGAGIRGRALLGRVVGRMPFERPWMAKYIDRCLDVDPSHTRRVLGLEPTPRSSELLFNFLAAAVRSGDRATMPNLVRELARIRLEEGFDCREVSGALTALRDAAAAAPPAARLEPLERIVGQMEAFYRPAAAEEGPAPKSPPGGAG